jgi:hypothetical protein
MLQIWGIVRDLHRIPPEEPKYNAQMQKNHASCDIYDDFELYHEPVPLFSPLKRNIDHEIEE